MENISAKLKRQTIGAFAPPSRLTVSQWAEAKRTLSREYSATEGKFRYARVPWAREPSDAIHHPDVRSVVLLWARQMTKTTVIENVMGYSIDADPAPMLMVQPTVEAACAYSKERLGVLLNDTPCLREKVSDAPTRDSSNTIQLKTFAGGSLAIMGANSPTGLGMRTRRIVMFDEVDRYPQSAGSEGDPITIGTKTTETFHNSITYLTSTPTVKGYSRVELEYERTDKRMWFVKCPHCGLKQTLQWPYVKFDNKPEDAHIVCCSAKCGRDWTEAQRVKAVMEGEWIPTAPFKGKRGYFINVLYSLFKPKKGYRTRLHQTADEFLEAKDAIRRGNIELMKAWINCSLAETWEEKTEKLDPVTITSRAEFYTPKLLPDKCLVIIGGADVQKDRIELEWQGIGLDEESWGIEVVKIFGDTEKPEVWKALSNEIQRTFTREDKVVLQPAALGIDTHYRPKMARAWCKSHGTKVITYPVLGANRDQAALVVDRFNKFYNQRVWSIETAQAKDIIYARLKIAEKGARFIHIPKGLGYTDEWAAQLTCERVVTRYVNGFPKRVYLKDENASNEAIDMRVYAIGALEILRPNLVVIDKLLKQQAEKLQGRSSVVEAPVKPKSSIGGGFVGGRGFTIGGGKSFVNG